MCSSVCFFCIVRYRSLRRDDYAFIGVLQDVFLCDREASKLRRPGPDLVCCATEKRKVFLISIQFSVRNGQSQFTAKWRFKVQTFSDIISKIYYAR
jgi:hypothetical protein